MREYLANVWAALCGRRTCPQCNVVRDAITRVRDMSRGVAEAIHRQSGQPDDEAEAVATAIAELHSALYSGKAI